MSIGGYKIQNTVPVYRYITKKKKSLSTKGYHTSFYYSSIQNQEINRQFSPQPSQTPLIQSIISHHKIKLRYRNCHPAQSIHSSLSQPVSSVSQATTDTNVLLLSAPRVPPDSVQSNPHNSFTLVQPYRLSSILPFTAINMNPTSFRT